MKISHESKYMLFEGILSACNASFMPVFYIFLSKIGYDIGQIGWYYGLFWLVSTLFEVPFGIFTDLFGTKRTIVISILFKIIGFVFLIWGTTGIGLLIIIALLTGIGEAGLSGTLPSWFVNVTQKKEKKDYISTIFAKTNNICCVIGLSVGFVTGQILYTMNHYYPVFLTLVLFSSSLFVFCLLLTDNDIEIKKQVRKKGIIKNFDFKKKRSIIVIFVTISTIDIINSGPGNQWQKIFEGMEMYGYLWIGVNLATLLGNWIISKAIIVKLSKGNSDLLVVMKVVLLFLMYALKNYSIVVFTILFFIYVVVYQVHYVLNISYIHTSVVTNDDTRNEEISIFNMTSSLMSTFSLIIGGYLGSFYGILLGWCIMGTVSFIIYFSFRNKVWR